MSCCPRVRRPSSSLKSCCPFWCSSSSSSPTCGSSSQAAYLKTLAGPSACSLPFSRQPHRGIFADLALWWGLFLRHYSHVFLNKLRVPLSL
jgi:hypothetical protein